MPEISSENISFFRDEESFILRNQKKVKSWLNSVFLQEGHRLKSLNIIFTSDHKLLEINIKHLNHNYYTDVITFCLNESPICGEIYISIDRVKENSKQLGVSFKNELLRVMVHGVLHLCGYRDKLKDEISEMRDKEDLYLGQILDLV